jgi:hypothetical protein
MEDFLKKKLGELNYAALLTLIKDNNIDLIFAKILGGLGLTTPDKIYLDEGKLNCHRPDVVFFTILHEIFHYKRIKLLGNAFFVAQFSNENFDEFHQFVVNEENFADRYGRLIFFKFNKFPYPVEFTQMLHDEYYASRYKFITKQMFELFKTKGSDCYDKLYEEFIIK